MGGVGNGLVEAADARVGVVGLLAALVCMDDEGVCAGGEVARAGNVWVQGGGDVLQQGVQGHAQSGF